MNLPSTKRKAQNPRAFLLNDNTDYLQMGHYTELLAVALTDIDGYVKDDKDIIPEHGYKDKEKDHKMMLPLLHKAINDLHGGISQYLPFSQALLGPVCSHPFRRYACCASRQIANERIIEVDCPAH